MISDFYTDTAFSPDKWETLPPPADLNSFSKSEQLRREFHLPKENFLDETMARTPSEIVDILRDEKGLKESIGNDEWFLFQWDTFRNLKSVWKSIFALSKLFIVLMLISILVMFLVVPEKAQNDMSWLWLVFSVIFLFGISSYFSRVSKVANNICFSRKTGMVSIPRKGEEPFVAPFYEFIPYYYTHHIMTGVNYHLYLGHRNKEIGAIHPGGGKHPQEMYADWALIQRFMDVSKPLPDIPLFEPFRQLDPTTKAYDAKTGRPEHYWRDMDIKRANKLHDASYKRIRQFPAFDQSKWRVAPIEATQWPAIENL